MPRIRLFVAALLCVGLAATIGAQDRKFDLKFKDKDKLVPFYQEMKTDVTQIIQVQGQPLTQNQKSTFWFQWTPLSEEKAKEGNEEYTRWKVKQKIEGLKMEIDISGNQIVYDSTKADTTGSAGNPGLLEFFKNLKDAEFTVTLGKNYKVEKVDEEDKKKFIAKLSAGSAQMESLLKKVMTDEALKEMADPTYKLFPPDGAAKKKGDKWERKTMLPLGPVGTYELTYKFTYAEPDKDGARKDMDKIEVETFITYAAPKENPEGLLFRIKDGSKLVTDTSGTPPGNKGVIYYDPKNQRIDYAEIKIKLKGELIVTIGGTDTKAELTQEQKTVIQTKDTSFLPGATPAPPPPPPK
ncbi:MAG: DUF6263 family protein [Planctomycetia bacterium]|nr:DUF6263 family protein [Planctomycetia bacterium]